MSRLSLLLLLPVLGAELLMCGCGKINTVAGGSSSETVIGKVIKEDGTPACSAVVMLYPVDYDPVADAPLPRSSTDTTDSEGNYTVTAPDSTVQYSITAVKRDSSLLAYIGAIDLQGGTTRAPDAVLLATGTIYIAAPDTADTNDGYVYIPGTGVFAYVKSAGGLIRINHVPAGTVPAINYRCRGCSGAPTTLISGISVSPADTIVIPFPERRFSRKLYLNTSSSGAGVSASVTDFPVLVRLSGINFDFSQTYPDGSDIRFSGADGSVLRYEIEWWDNSSRSAGVWVRVPIIKGNNNSQYIVMHWGATGGEVKSLSSSVGVFDTAAGFQGVWHLSGTGNAPVSDATANGYHGICYDMTTASAVAGAIGYARYFNGSTTYIVIPNSSSGKLDMAQNSHYSVSAWVYADTIDTLWHAIAAKGHEQYYLKLKCFGKGRATWEFVEFQDQKGWEFTEDSVPPAPGAKQWVYLTGVRSGSRQLLYINGVLVNEAKQLMAGNYARNTSDNFTIGRHGREVLIPYYEGWCYFRGAIDEVRVLNFAPGADWIKLCYMNQKAQDALVEFR